jgi:hypothetical protein
MKYLNFHTHITRVYGLVIEGWPLGRFCSPSQVGSHTELRALYKAFSNNVTRFVKLDRAVWESFLAQIEVIAPNDTTAPVKVRLDDNTGVIWAVSGEAGEPIPIVQKGRTPRNDKGKSRDKGHSSVGQPDQPTTSLASSSSARQVAAASQMVAVVPAPGFPTAAHVPVLHDFQG